MAAIIILAVLGLRFRMEVRMAAVSASPRMGAEGKSGWPRSLCKTAQGAAEKTGWPRGVRKTAHGAEGKSGWPRGVRKTAQGAEGNPANVDKTVRQ